MYNLIHLDLSYNKLTVLEGVHTKLGNIKTLNLAGNQLDSLVGLSKLYSLVNLDLSGNKLGQVEKEKKEKEKKIYTKIKNLPFYLANKTTKTNIHIYFSAGRDQEHWSPPMFGEAQPDQQSHVHHPRLQDEGSGPVLGPCFRGTVEPPGPGLGPVSLVLPEP